MNTLTRDRRRDRFGRLDDFATLVIVAGTLLDLAVGGLAVGDVDQPSAWGRVVLFSALGLSAAGLVAASFVVVCLRGGRYSDPETKEWPPRSWIPWLAGVGAGLIAVAMSLAAASFASDSAAEGASHGSGPAATAPTGGEGSSGKSDDELAREFRPVLFFDSGEPWRPLNVDDLLSEDYPGGSRHQICGPTKGSCEPVSGLRGLTTAVATSPSLGQGMYLDLVGDGVWGNYKSPRLSVCQHETQVLECDDNASAIYYNVTFHSGLVFIDYWWFLRYNHVDRLVLVQRGLRKLCGVKEKLRAVCFDHEGDWEGVTVVVSAASTPRLEAVVFAAHEWTLLYTASQIKTAEGRPEIYIARGSHAAYPAPCDSRCHQPLSRFGFRWPEGQHDGLRPWLRNPDDKCFTAHPCVLPLTDSGDGSASSWVKWSGKWGYVCAPADKSCRVGNGPESPGTQKRFETPWCRFGKKRKGCDAVAKAIRTTSA